MFWFIPKVLNCPKYWRNLFAKFYRFFEEATIQNMSIFEVYWEGVYGEHHFTSKSDVLVAIVHSYLVHSGLFRCLGTGQMGEKIHKNSYARNIHSIKSIHRCQMHVFLWLLLDFLKKLHTIPAKFTTRWRGRWWFEAAPWFEWQQPIICLEICAWEICVRVHCYSWKWIYAFCITCNLSSCSCTKRLEIYKEIVFF